MPSDRQFSSCLYTSRHYCSISVRPQGLLCSRMGEYHWALGHLERLLAFFDKQATSSRCECGQGEGSALFKISWFCCKRRTCTVHLALRRARPLVDAAVRLGDQALMNDHPMRNRFALSKNCIALCSPGPALRERRYALAYLQSS